MRSGFVPVHPTASIPTPVSEFVPRPRFQNESRLLDAHANLSAYVSRLETAIFRADVEEAITLLELIDNEAWEMIHTIADELIDAP